jgi:hypothetical protein
VLVFFEVVLSVFLVLPPLLPLWCVVFWLLLVCGAGDLVSLCVGCFVCGWLLLGVCLVARVFLVVFLLLLVLFCFGLSAVLWSSWCWLCVVARAVVLLVGCRGCVALSAFLLLVVLWLLRCSGCWCVSPVRCTVLVLVAPGWFMRLVVLLVVGLLVLLSPLFCVGSCRFVTIWFLTQNATLVGWLCGVACAYL